MKPMTKEKRDIIIRLQEAIGRSDTRLNILESINKKESTLELRKRLKIPAPTFSKAIARLETYKLIKRIEKKNKSRTYDKNPLLKQMGNLRRWVNFEIQGTESTSIESKKFKIKKKIPSSVPFLDSTYENDARKMAEGPYVVLYLFENSVRRFIDDVLTSKYKGRNWWKIVTKKEIVEKVKDRKKLEGMNKWHVRRGAHNIFYTGLEDLAYFLNKEKSEFGKHINVDLWTTYIKEVVKLSRNIVSHHNPLPTREINRLNTILDDWKREFSYLFPLKISQGTNA